MLLSRRRPDQPDEPIPADQTIDASGAGGPTIPLRLPTPIQVAAPRYRTSDRPEGEDPRVMALPASGEVVVGQNGRIQGYGDQRDYTPLARPPFDTSVPAGSGMGTGAGPTVPIKPRNRVDEAADVVRKYDQGLHPDPKTGAWVPYHRNKGLQILEGLGNVAASGVGINLQNILHPRGTPEQQARRRLSDEIGIQDQSIRSQRATTDLEGDQATIALHRAQARKIQDELDNPDTSEERKAELELLKEGLRTHPGPFDPTNPDDAAFIKRLAAAKYPINVAGYGKQPKEESGFSLTPGEARYDAKGNLIVERAPKAEPEVPDTTGPIGEQEARFRTNAAAAQAAAEKAEADVKTYIAQQKVAHQTDPNKPESTTYDPEKDANVASLAAEARRQRDFHDDQLKRADDLTVKKIEAGNKITTGRAKSKGRATLNEDQVRAAAKAAGLDPDIAVKRARARGQL